MPETTNEAPPIDAKGAADRLHAAITAYDEMAPSGDKQDVFDSLFYGDFIPAARNAVAELRLVQKHKDASNHAVLTMAAMLGVEIKRGDA